MKRKMKSHITHCLSLVKNDELLTLYINAKLQEQKRVLLAESYSNGTHTNMHEISANIAQV